jgi:multidrug efflux pump
VLATGAGAAARHSIGTGIIGGMVGATTLALFFVPLFYYLVISAKERMSGGRPASVVAESTGEAGSADDV